MSATVWLALSLPLQAALLFIFIREQNKTLRLIAKGAATYVAVITAALGQSLSGAPAARLIPAALAVFAAADVILDVRFVPGVAVFALGHGLLILFLLRQGFFHWAAIPLAAALYGLSLAVFRRHLRAMGRLTVPFLLYPAVLTFMAAAALLLPPLGGWRYLPFAAGAVLFTASDLMVAANVLVGLSPKWPPVIMALYEAAVLLIALTAWTL